MKKELQIKFVDCRITEDNYSEGQHDKLFHSFEIPLAANFDLDSPNLKDDILNLISEQAFDSPKLSWKDIEFDEEYNRIHYCQQVKYMPKVDWQEFYVPTKGEIASWNMGKKKLYDAEYAFSFEVVEVLNGTEIKELLTQYKIITS